MATFRTTVRFIRTNPSASLLLVIYILMWWAPIRPLALLTTGRSDVPYGINGPIEWMSRWWLSIDAPTLFQPIALLGAWFLAFQRRNLLRAAWARTCRSASRRGAKWAAYSWIPLGLLLVSATTAFLGHITPLAVTTLVWLPLGVITFVYGPRVQRALHTPSLLLISATAVPDTYSELLQQYVHYVIGVISVRLGALFGTPMSFDHGNVFNPHDDYLRSGNLNAPIAGPMNGLALITSTVVLSVLWTLHKRRGIASAAAAKLTSIAVAGVCVCLHILLIVITLHSGHRGYTVGSLHNALLLPLTITVTLVILKTLHASSFGHTLRTLDRKAILWFVRLPDIRRRKFARNRQIPQKQSKPALPIVMVLFRMVTSPFRIYWRWMIRLDTKLSKWESAASKNKRARK